MGKIPISQTSEGEEEEQQYNSNAMILEDDEEGEDGLEFWTEFPSAMKALSLSYNAGCRYKHGCYKSPAFNNPDTMPPSYAKLFREYKEKYDIYDVQLFTSISSSYGIGWHTDPDIGHSAHIQLIILCHPRRVLVVVVVVVWWWCWWWLWWCW